MPCCKAEQYGWCQHLETVNYRNEQGEEYCLFHAPQGQKGISQIEFNNEVFKRINQAIRTNSLCDFSGTIFEGDIDFFSQYSLTPLPWLRFLHATFSGITRFYSITFGGFEADFSFAKFNRNADFAFSTFKGNAFFTHAKFVEDALFFSSTFDKFAMFASVVFQRKANFSNTTFNSVTDFRDNTFYGGGNLIELEIRDGIRFEEVDLREVSFIDTNLSKATFINCIWPADNYKRNMVFDEIILFTISSKNDFINRAKKVESIYRCLKHKYKEEHNETEVSNWHYGEKEMMRKRSNHKTFPFYMLNLYWIASGYSEQPVRAGIVLMLLIFYSSFLLTIAGLTVADHVQTNTVDFTIHGIQSISWPNNIDLQKAWATFLNTVKYVTFQKDFFFRPTNWWGETIKVLSQILIPLQAALLVLSVRNKFRR